MKKMRMLDLQRQLRDLRKTTNEPGYAETQRSSLAANVEQQLSSPTLDNLLGTMLECQKGAIFEGAVGAAKAAHGEQDGWQHLQLGLAYLGWYHRLSVGLFRRGRIQRGFTLLPPNKLALCLAHAVTAREDALANWCGQTLVEFLTTDGGLYTAWYTPFEPFMAHLYTRWRKLPPPVNAVRCVSLGVYQRVLDDWDDNGRFAAAIAEACNYHLHHAIPLIAPGAEFTFAAYDVFPAEMLAIKRVRDEQGLSWPEVKHPLLDTPLFHPPERMPAVKNELIDRVAAVVREVMPEVAV